MPGPVLDFGDTEAGESSGLGALGAQKSVKTSTYNRGSRCRDRGGTELWGLVEEHLNLAQRWGEGLRPGSPE